MNTRQLVRTVTEGAQSFDILGYLVWWNVRNANVTQDQFKEMLRDAGLNEKYARSHNYRSAFTRALRIMEEKRIIRTVEEDGFFWKVQFTTENKLGNGDGAELSYDKETIITIDKKRYQEDRDFRRALTQGRDDIKSRLAELFEVEKDRYNSSDITRYIQGIFRDNADMVALREQGAVYFVPAHYIDTIRAVDQIMSRIGDSRFCWMPLVNTENARSAIGSAFNDEAEALIEKLDTELENASTVITSKWRDHRIKLVSKLKKRVALYSSVLDEQAGEALVESLEQVRVSVLGLRVLELD